MVNGEVVPQEWRQTSPLMGGVFTLDYSDMSAPSPPSPLRGGIEGGGRSVAHRMTPSPALLRPLRAKRRYPPRKGEGARAARPRQKNAPSKQFPRVGGEAMEQSRTNTAPAEHFTNRPQGRRRPAWRRPGPMEQNWRKPWQAEGSGFLPQMNGPAGQDYS